MDASLHTVAMRADGFHQRYNFPPKEEIPRIGRHVKQLALLTHDAKAASSVLEGCPNVENLLLILGSSREKMVAGVSLDFQPLIQDVQRRPIKRLAIELEGLCQWVVNQPEAASPSFTLAPKQFIHLTHLEILPSLTNDTEHYLSIDNFPSLTHLAIRQFSVEFIGKLVSTSHDDNCPPSCRSPHSNALQIIVLDCGFEEFGSFWKELNEKVSDDRLVLFNFRDVSYALYNWKQGAYGRRDMWHLAESIKKQRFSLKDQRELIWGCY